MPPKWPLPNNCVVWPKPLPVTCTTWNWARVKTYAVHTFNPPSPVCLKVKKTSPKFCTPSNKAVKSPTLKAVLSLSMPWVQPTKHIWTSSTANGAFWMANSTSIWKSHPIYAHLCWFWTKRWTRPKVHRLRFTTAATRLWTRWMPLRTNKRLWFVIYKWAPSVWPCCISSCSCCISCAAWPIRMRRPMRHAAKPQKFWTP